MTNKAQRAKEAFGGRLREIRQDAGLTGRQLAELTGFHFTKISRAEHGAQGLSDADIRAWCRACDASDEVTALIAQARAAESLYREWKRQARSGLRRLQETIGPLYEQTSLFRIHEHWSIPGLLQTAAYSAESMTYWSRLLKLPDDHQAATAARLERQRVLRSGNHRFVFLLAEQTLYTRIGTVETMVEQLDRVLGVMALANVSIGIIPAAGGLGTHTQTAFWIFDDDLVKVQSPDPPRWTSPRPDGVAIYVTVFGQMRKAARYRQSARALILKARDELLK